MKRHERRASIDLPLQLIVFTLPSLIYLAVQRRRGKEWSLALDHVGWRGCSPKHYLWGLGVMVLVGGLGWPAFQIIPPDVLQDPNLNVSEYADWKPTLTSFLLIWVREAVYVALGEEVLFRGFLGGWLMRRLGFAIGNTVQALTFLLPHLLLLSVSLSLWLVVVVQLVTGWLLGWLRHRSASILPGWLAHSLANALGALAAMA